MRRFLKEVSDEYSSPSTIPPARGLAPGRLRRRPAHLPGSQEDRLEALCPPVGGVLLRLPLQGQPRRPGQLRLRAAQERQARRAHRVGAHSPGLGHRPPAPVLAERRAQQLLAARPGVPARRGRPVQPGAEHRRGQRRPQQLRLRLAAAAGAAVWRLPDGHRLQGEEGHAAPADPRDDRPHLLLHERPLRPEAVQAGPPAVPGLEQAVPGGKLGAPAQPDGRLRDGLGQSVRGQDRPAGLQ